MPSPIDPNTMPAGHVSTMFEVAFIVAAIMAALSDRAARSK